MSTGELHRPSRACSNKPWQAVSDCGSVAAPINGVAMLVEKNTCPPASGGQVPSETSLGWLFIMITQGAEHVNGRIGLVANQRALTRSLPTSQ